MYIKNIYLKIYIGFVISGILEFYPLIFILKNFSLTEKMKSVGIFKRLLLSRKALMWQCMSCSFCHILFQSDY